MKKRIKKNCLALFFSLIGISLSLFLNGCNYEKYNAERLYWKANNLYQQLVENIKTAKPQDYQKVINALQKVTLRYPDWNNTPTAQLLIGRVYAAQNNVEQAKTEFEKILKDYPTNANADASALLSLGRIYEEQNKWDDALEYYNKIFDDYIYTYGAYQCALHIIQYYNSKNQNAQAEAVYHDIFKRYEKFIKENVNTSFAMAAEHFIVALMLDIKKWDEVIVYLENLIETHPKSEIALRSLYTMAAVYDENLNKPEKAIATYQKIIDDYPNNEKAKLAKERIEAVKARPREKK